MTCGCGIHSAHSAHSTHSIHSAHTVSTLNWTTYHNRDLFLCWNCIDSVLKALENSVTMSVTNNCCWTNVSYWHIKGSIFSIKDVYCKMGSHNITECEWKFTNDARRRIIRDINIILSNHIDD